MSHATTRDKAAPRILELPEGCLQHIYGRCACSSSVGHRSLPDIHVVVVFSVVCSEHLFVGGTLLYNRLKCPEKKKPATTPDDSDPRVLDLYLALDDVHHLLRLYRTSSKLK